VSGDICFLQGRVDDAEKLYCDIARQSEESGFMLYRLWASFGIARCLRSRGKLRDALRKSRGAARIAGKSGYRWWQLRHLIVGAQVYHDLTGEDRISAKPNAMLKQSAALIADIRSSIGDESIRHSFESIAILRDAREVSQAYGVTI